MCGSEELIHDARQVDLEDVIMTNETPMYLVPGKLTDAQARAFAHAHACHMGEAAALRAIAAIGTPIQPCADVETVGWVNPTLLTEIIGGVLSEMALAGCETQIRTVPLVRRTDMEAQVARVVAEKDAEIARLWEYYDACEAIFEEGIINSTPDMFRRRERAQETLKGGAS